VNHRYLPAFLLIAALLGGSPQLSGQDLPSADELVDAYVEAIGGRDAYLGISSMRQTGTVTVMGLGVNGAFEILQVAPNRMLNRIELPGVGEVLTGFDGDAGWSVNPLLGPMLMEGAELEQTGERAHVLATLRDSEMAPVRETVELSEYRDEPCWTVRFVWASGRESLDCFSTETGLLVASEESQASPMGEVPVTVIYAEYREFGDMVIPTRITQSTMGQDMEIRIEEVVFDDVNPSRLDPPPAVQALLQGSDRE
jgi:hypothetical protein